MSTPLVPEPTRVLYAALTGVLPGEYWAADRWHEQAAAAQLTSAEIAAAHQDAISAGHLVRVVVRVGSRTAAVQVPSTVPSRKGGGVQLLVRTSKSLPGEPAPIGGRHVPAHIDGQLDMLEGVGA